MSESNDSFVFKVGVRPVGGNEALTYHPAQVQAPSKDGKNRRWGFQGESSSKALYHGLLSQLKHT
jgi:hypothetical protein